MIMESNLFEQDRSSSHTVVKQSCLSQRVLVPLDAERLFEVVIVVQVVRVLHRLLNVRVHLFHLSL